MWQRTRLTALTLAACLAGTLFFAPAARASVCTWNASSGVWSTGANWLNSGGSPPNGYYDAYINNGGTATVNASGGTCYGLFLGNTSAGTGTVQMTGGYFAATTEEDVGQYGTGTFTQSGGTNSAPLGYSFALNLYVGTNTNSSGNYNLNGPGVLNTSGTLNTPGGAEYVGYSGTGTFTQSAGTNNTANLYLGTNSNGTYNLNGGMLTCQQISGGAGTSIFNFNGGTLLAGVGASSNFLSGLTAASVEFGGLTVDTNGQNITIAQPLLYYLLGSGSVIKQGAGTLTLSGANTYGGYYESGTYINAGILAAANGSALGAGQVTVSGGTLDATACALSINGLDMYNSGTLNLSVGNLLLCGGFDAAVAGTLNVGGNPTANSTALISSAAVITGQFATANLPVGYELQYTTYQLNLVHAYCTWATAAGGSWATAANWSPGWAPSARGGQATINAATTSPLTITLDGPQTVGSLLLGNVASNTTGYTLSAGSGGALTLDNAGSAATITITGGSHVISAPVVLAAGATVTPAAGATLTISGNISQSGPSGLTLNGPGTLVLAGADSFTGGTTIGPGAMVVTQSLNMGGALTINAGGTLTQSGGWVSATGLVSNNGLYTINGSNLTASGGLTNYATLAVTGGGSVAGNVTNYYGAALNANGATVSGSLTNYGALTQSGPLNLGTLSNYGVVTVNPGGAMSGGGTFTNYSGGILHGDGYITMALSNSGLIDANGGAGLTLANFSGNNLRGGILQVEAGDSMQVLNGGSPIYNFGTINLKGDNSQLSGDPLHNGYQAAGLSGTMQGQGYILNSVTNDGTISPQGGQLVISGAGCENDSAGAIKLAAGTGILFTQGISQNYGLISLAGGTFDNNNNPLTNWGSILGNGTFSSGTLSNYNVVTFSGGNSSIYGVVNNVYGGTINTTEATYFGNVVNYGYVKATGGTVSMLAGFTNYGTYHSDPAANYFTGLTVGSGGVLQGGVGDSFYVTAPFTSAGQIDLGGTCLMVVQNGGTLVQTAGQIEMGTSATLSAGSVEINGGTLLADGPAAAITANLVYGSPASSTYQGTLAGAGNSLLIDNPAALLVLSGTGNSFTGGAYVEAGMLEVTSAGGLPNGASLMVGAEAATYFAAVLPATASAADAQAVPEPATLALLTAAVCGAAMFRRSRRWKAR